MNWISITITKRAPNQYVDPQTPSYLCLPYLLQDVFGEGSVIARDFCLLLCVSQILDWEYFYHLRKSTSQSAILIRLYTNIICQGEGKFCTSQKIHI